MNIKIIACEHHLIDTFDQEYLPDFMNPLSSLLMEMLSRNTISTPLMCFSEYTRDNLDHNIESVIAQLPHTMQEKITFIDSHVQALQVLLENSIKPNRDLMEAMKPHVLSIVGVVYAREPNRLVHWQNFIEKTISMISSREVLR